MELDGEGIKCIKEREGGRTDERERRERERERERERWRAILGFVLYKCPHSTIIPLTTYIYNPNLPKTFCSATFWLKHCVPSINNLYNFLPHGTLILILSQLHCITR